MSTNSYKLLQYIYIYHFDINGAPKLNQQLQRSVKAVEANANGTSGYKIKEGKNAGKILKHIRKDSNKI